MRIIAGDFKGRRLVRPKAGIRPTSDRLREAVFACLGVRVRGSIWIDAFAGSGAIGLEALSRGARFVSFNDQSEGAARILQRNIQACQLGDGYAVFRMDTFKFLLQPRPDPVDFIYLDPPYHQGLETRLLKTLEDAPPELQRATLLFEHFKKTQLKLVQERWQRLRTLKAGDSQVEILRLLF